MAGTKTAPAPKAVPDGSANQHDDETLAEILAAIAAARARPGSDLDHLPSRLSPSRASDFVQCPQAFYFKTICGITEPSTVQNARGTLFHGVVERIFDHPEGERTVELALTYLRPTWEDMTCLDLDEEKFPEGSAERKQQVTRANDYLAIAPKGSETEAEILDYAEMCVRNWFLIERVNNFSPTNLVLPDGTVIDGREFHAVFEMFGVTLHGFIDRLDMWVDSRGVAHWSVSDYKTGRYAGEGKSYAQHTMDRIRYESFFQLRFYAVLCWEMLGIKVEKLRLLYVKNEDKAVAVKELAVTQQIIDSTREEIRTIWKGISTSARTGRWNPRTGPLCNYCYFQAVCPEFNPDITAMLAESDERQKVS